MTLDQKDYKGNGMDTFVNNWPGIDLGEKYLKDPTTPRISKELLAGALEKFLLKNCHYLTTFTSNGIENSYSYKNYNANNN